MNTFNNVCVIVPVFNEKNIINVIDELKKIFSKIIIVDDGSEISISTELTKLKVITLRHCINLGQGAALDTAFEYVQKNKEFLGCEFILTFDGDGQHSVEDAKNMVLSLMKSGYDIALGNRFFGDLSGIPKKRLVVLKLGKFFSYFILGLNFKDPSNGLRAISVKKIALFKLKQYRMAHATEILQIVKKYNLQYIEVNASVNYTKENLLKGQKNYGFLFILLNLIFKGSHD